MQNRGGYLEEPDAATAAAQLSRRGARVSGCRCARCSLLQPSVVPAALAASGSPNRRPQSWRLPPLQQLRRSCYSPPPLLLFLLLIVAICALVGVAVSHALVRLGDGGGGGSHCDSTVAKLEFGKVVREAVERFYEKALPALCGHVRQPPAAFLPFAGANDEDECVLPMSSALRTAGLTSSHDSTTAFAATTQGRLRVPISGYYYVFTQVGAQRLTARTEVINIMLEAVRGRSEKDEAATTTDNEQRQSEPLAARRSDDQLTLASVTPRISESGAQVETPSIFLARVVRLHAGDELKLRLLCDRSGSGSGHRCGFESVTEVEACRRYHIGAHLIAPMTER